MKNKGFTVRLIYAFLSCAVFLLCAKYIFQITIDLVLIIISILVGFLVAFSSLLLNRIKVGNKIESILVVAWLVYIVIMLKTHFYQALMNNYRLLETAFVLITIEGIIIDSAQKLKNRKIIANQSITQLNKTMNLFILLLGSFFLIYTPLQNLIPEYYLWIDIPVGFVLLLLSLKIYPLFCIVEKDSK